MAVDLRIERRLLRLVDALRLLGERAREQLGGRDAVAARLEVLRRLRTWWKLIGDAA